MSQWLKRTPWRDPPNEKNYGYTRVPVPNGTTRSKRYGCSGCSEQLPEKETYFIVESTRLDAWVTTSFGSFYVYASGSAYPSGNRSWPYCRECLNQIKSRLFQKKLKMKKAEANGETYKEGQCSHCGRRHPTNNMRTYVLRPGRIVHRNGGRGMTAASFPVIRGKAIRALCSDCSPEFSPERIDDIEEDTVQATS